MERPSAHFPRFHLVNEAGEPACGARVFFDADGDAVENPPQREVCGRPACWEAWCKLNKIPLTSATGSRGWAR